MGIGSSDLRRLIELRQSGHIPDRCSVVEIGAQQLDDSFLEATNELEWIRRAFNVEAPCPLPRPLATTSADGKLPMLDRNAPRARDFWTWLELDYAAIDIDASPGSIPLDLNYDQVPAESKGKFQLVTNFGSTEHVANQLNAFEIIHDLTAPGGVMIHYLPAQGMFNHGLVNYNPKFFWKLCRSNAYKLLHMSFSSLDTSEPLPLNVIECVSDFEPEFAQRVVGYRASDSMLAITTQKVVDTAFVAPLDVDFERTNDEVLKRRYWTVFEPIAIETLVYLNGKIDAVVRQMAVHTETMDRRLGGVIEHLAGQSGLTDRRLDGLIQQMAGQSEVVDRRLFELTQQLAGQSEVVDRRLDAVIQQLATQSEVLDHRLSSVIEQLASQGAAVDRRLESTAQHLSTQSEVSDRRLYEVVQQLAGQSEVADRHLDAVVQRLGLQAEVVDRHLAGITQQLASQAEVSDRRLEALVQQVAAQAQAIDRHLQTVAQHLKVQAEVLDHRLNAAVQALAGQSALLDEKLGDVAGQLAKSPARSLWRAVRFGRKPAKPNSPSQ